VDRLLVEGVGLALGDADRAARTLSEAGAEPVAQPVGGELRLPVLDVERALGAGRDAVAAAVAERLVDFHDLANHEGGFSHERGVWIESGRASVTSP
jgi:hypothetical protein